MVLYFCFSSRYHKSVTRETQNKVPEARDERHVPGTGRRWLQGDEKTVTGNQIQEIQEAGQRAADVNSDLTSLGE